MSYRVGDACKAPQRDGFVTPVLTLQLQGAIALSMGHRGALRGSNCRPLHTRAAFS